MKHFIIILILAGGALLVSQCSPGDEPVISCDPESLDSTQWILTAFGPTDTISLIAALADSSCKVPLIFDHQNHFIMGDCCNQGNGNYDADNHCNISFETYGWTILGCIPPPKTINVLGKKTFIFLDYVKYFHVTGNQLVLRDSLGQETRWLRVN